MVLLKLLGLNISLVLCFSVVMMVLSYKEDKIEKGDIQTRAYYRKYLAQMIAFLLIALGLANILFSFRALDINLIIHILCYIMAFVFSVLGLGLLIAMKAIDFEQMIIDSDREKALNKKKSKDDEE